MSKPNRIILLIGKSGQLGGELIRLNWPDLRIYAPGRDEVDLLAPETLTQCIDRYQPDLVINAAADTAVDRAESQPDLSMRANSMAPELLAHACAKSGARLFHFSTDYVFSGDREVPYKEDDAVSPVNAYGCHKRIGEEAVLAASDRHMVCRLSWVYGTRGRNFALTMLRLAREGKPIRVVDDQIGSPTYVRHIAEAVQTISLALLADPSAPGGRYHLTSAGSTSWQGFASALLSDVLGDQAPEVTGIPTSEYPTPARRPRFSVLDNSRVAARFGAQLPDWRSQVQDWARDLAVIEKTV